MRFLKTWIATVAGCGLLVAQAEYEVNIIFKNGAERTLNKLVVQAGKVILAEENLSVPFEQIERAVFTFQEPLTFRECESMLQRGAYQELLDGVNALLEPVKQGLELPGNLDRYVQYQVRASFWTGQYGQTLTAARILENKNSLFKPLIGLYEVLVLLEQGRPAEEVARAFSGISNPDSISAAIAEYIRGRLAAENREYETALQHFSNVLVYHRRDPEWAPAAAWHEAAVYKKTGYLESAANIVEQFEIAYPDSYWGVRADELK
jgi:tetratricopeptide (TPR) repeat protein